MKDAELWKGNLGKEAAPRRCTANERARIEVALFLPPVLDARDRYGQRLSSTQEQLQEERHCSRMELLWLHRGALAEKWAARSATALSLAC